jgi:hypothetical protein
MKQVEIRDSEKAESQEWDRVLGEAARLGWLLPGAMENLGWKTRSWNVK